MKNDELVQRLRGYSDEGVGAGGQLAHDLEHAADEIESAAQSDSHGVREGMMRAAEIAEAATAHAAFQSKECYRFASHIKTAITRAADSLPQDSNTNAPWLTIAHNLCTDAGIKQGHIAQRLEDLGTYLCSLQESLPQERKKS